VDLGLNNRKALVTAASRGLGKACAAALAAEGASVFIASRDAAAIESAGKEIKATGWKAADVSMAGAPAALVEAAIAKQGGLDILVVNAGGPPRGTFESTPLESWPAAFDLTLMSAVNLVHAALPRLKESDQARIVFITSISVRQPIPSLVLSNSLRAAVTGLAKTLALELAPHRITVNCLAPDAILTDRIRELSGGDPATIEARAQHHPMKRFGDPAEFGAVCAFLCSSHAGFISGQTVGVDGGALVGVH